MFALVLWRLRDRFRPGLLFAIYLIGAGLERFLVEFVRRNEDVALGLTQAQLLSIAMMLAGGDLDRRRPESRDASTPATAIRRRSAHRSRLARRRHGASRSFHRCWRRSDSQQLFLRFVAPAILGAVVGLVVGISAPLYWVLQVVATIGGLGAGIEHRGAAEGAKRGVVGGAIYGALILIVHELTGAEAEVELGEVPILLVVVTALPERCSARSAEPGAPGGPRRALGRPGEPAVERDHGAGQVGGSLGADERDEVARTPPAFPSRAAGTSSRAASSAASSEP